MAVAAEMTVAADIILAVEITVTYGLTVTAEKFGLYLSGGIAAICYLYLCNHI